jgi:hypothetical protein
LSEADPHDLVKVSRQLLENRHYIKRENGKTIMPHRLVIVKPRERIISSLPFSCHLLHYYICSAHLSDGSGINNDDSSDSINSSSLYLFANVVDEYVYFMIMKVGVRKCELHFSTVVSRYDRPERN